jgi:hypothetical protein
VNRREAVTSTSRGRARRQLELSGGNDARLRNAVERADSRGSLDQNRNAALDRWRARGPGLERGAARRGRRIDLEVDAG